MAGERGALPPPHSLGIALFPVPISQPIQFFILMEFSLIVIGAGPGGYETALAAARAGLHTALVERGAVGGTCLNEGCIPTKCLCRSAQLLHDMQSQASSLGITAGPVSFDLSQAVSRTDSVTAQLRNGIHTLLRRTPGLTYIQGEASFVDNRTIAIDGGAQLLTAPSIIIATGSGPRSLPIPGSDLPGVLTSTDLLRLTALPSRLCVIGGGVIGLEFASIFNAFGSSVTVLEYAPEFLPAFDVDMARRLRTSLKRQGIACITHAKVTGISPSSENAPALSVTYEDKAQSPCAVEADVVLMAVGRSPRIDGLHAETAGVEVSPRGIPVDDDMQTNVPGIYAIGDVNGRCMLAHAATAQGKTALRHILVQSGTAAPAIEAPAPDAPVPGAVFTHPELASVGLTEEQCRASSLDCAIGKAMFAANGKACAIGEGEGIAKLLVERDTHRLLGAHVLGPHASDLIHEIVPLLTQGASIDALHTTIHAHPTLSEIWAAAAESIR